MLISQDAQELATLIQHGAVVAYPTEAVFGLGCDPGNEAAVKRLLTIKQRAIEKGLILIASHLDQLAGYIETTEIPKQLFSSQQKPITWLVPAIAATPDWITGKHNTIAIRISQHPACQTLCDACGHPLVSTSANPAQQVPAKTKQEVITYFDNTIDAIFDASIGEYRKPSEIRDSQTGDIIRKG